MNKDFGFIKDEIKPEDYVLGSLRSAPFEELQPSGQWTDFLPEGERQNRQGVETFSCFPYFTEILMEDFSYKRISEIKAGEYIITHKGVKNRVSQVFKRDYKGEFIEIKIKGIYEPIISTPEHPILTADGWKKAGEITCEDLVVLPTTNNLIKDSTIYEIEKNKDFLWLLGFYLAEGSIGLSIKYIKNDNPKLKVRGTGNGRGTIQFSIHSNETDFAEKIIKIGNNLFGVNFQLYNKKETLSSNVIGYNIFLRDLFEELGGVYSNKKEINKRLMFLEPLLQLEIVRGWLDGDGHISRNKRRICGVSISKNLINQIYRILLRNNIKSSIIKRKKRENRQDTYQIDIYATEINKLYDFGLENTSVIPLKNRKEKFISSEFLFKKINSVKKLKLKNSSRVYNLEVENDNSYITSNVAVHNCVSFGTLNIIETLFNRKFKELKNYSERFTAIVSNTGPAGNSSQAVAESVRKLGIIDDQKLPFFDGMSYEMFFSPKPMTENYLINGKNWLNEYEMRHEFVFYDNDKNKPEKLMEALKTSPVGVAVVGWNQRNGLYYKPENGKDNHFVVLVGYEKGKRWIIYDSYPESEGDFLKDLEWSYDFSQAKRYWIEKKDIIQMSIMEKIIATLYKVVGLLSLLVAKKQPIAPPIPVEPIKPVEPIVPSYLWDTKANARNSVRIICDEEGLTLKQKNEVTETINCESGFKTNAVNKNTNGTSDYGIIQANSYWYIGKGKPIASIDEAINNPTFCVRIMARAFKNGRAKDWICYRRLYG